MAAAARAHAENRYSWPPIAHSLHECLISTVNKELEETGTDDSSQGMTLVLFARSVWLSEPESVLVPDVDAEAVLLHHESPPRQVADILDHVGASGRIGGYLATVRFLKNAEESEGRASRLGGRVPH